MEAQPKPTINLQQEEFCRLYASTEEFFGNGTRSYAQAYGIDVSDRKQYQVAAAEATRLLKSVKVCDRIHELLELDGLNDEFVDKELLFIIKQGADVKAKVAAIREYNQLKARIKSSTTLFDKDSVQELTAFFRDMANVKKPSIETDDKK